MNDTTLMEVPDGVNNRTNDVPGFFLSVNFFLHDFLVQLPSCQIFENQVNVFFVCVKVVELHNIRVTYVFHNVNFSLKQNLFFLVHFLPQLT